MSSTPSDERRDATWRLTVRYLGGGVSGWQKQDGQRTVQEELEKAVAKVAGADVFVRGAGRTDAGVHARGQVASCRFESRIREDQLVLALGSILPDDVAVSSAEVMPHGFDAKRHSVGKRYVYRVYTGAVRDPFVDATAWHHRGPLDVAAMYEAARHLVGEHDFESFRSTGCVAAHARRYLWRVDPMLESPTMIAIEVRGNAFCQHMVRIIAGTLVEVGRGRFAPSDVPEMLAARDRAATGMTAPAKGLTLERVYYPDTLDDAAIPEGASFPGYPVTEESWPPKEHPPVVD